MNSNKAESISDEGSRKNDHRLRLLYLYQLLQKYTDADHSLSTPEILERMRSEYGISTHRTTLPEDIDLLRAAGVEIIAERRQRIHYYLEGRLFSQPELRLLTDAVRSSRFITEAKSRDLINKLGKLTSEPEAETVFRPVHIPSGVKSDNEKIYYIADTIGKAMTENRKIQFHYYDYDGNKRKILRNNGLPYTVSPYDLIWDGDFYYLTGYCDERQEVRVFRVDRIFSCPEIKEEKLLPRPADYDVERYTSEVFRMYATQEAEVVQLLCNNRVMRGVIDQFGTDVKTCTCDNEHFRAKVRVCASPNFYRWVFGWDGLIQIEYPAHIREEYAEMLRRALNVHR